MTQTIADFAQKVRELEALACPTPEDKPFFERHLRTAPGSSYKEALEYVIRCRVSRAN